MLHCTVTIATTTTTHSANILSPLLVYHFMHSFIKSLIAHEIRCQWYKSGQNKKMLHVWHLPSDKNGIPSHQARHYSKIELNWKGLGCWFVIKYDIPPPWFFNRYSIVCKTAHVIRRF